MSSDKELFKVKYEKETAKKRDERCDKKAPRFIEARSQSNFEGCFHELAQNMDITIDEGRFVYFLDLDFKFNTSIGNISPDYSKILSNGLDDLFYDKDDCTNEFCDRYNSVLSDMIAISDRILKKLDNKDKRYGWFENIKDKAAEGFEEALQRILFLNQLIWQTGSNLVGLSRLDKLIYPYYEKDIEEGRITPEDAKLFIEDFLRTLHNYYWYKSGVLLGDTGQVIIIGGLDENGNYEVNELTYLLMDAVKECRLSDPKIVLRTSVNMPKKLMEEAVRCMATGIGSPLLSNDDVIIPKLTAFGVEKKDACAYTTSACWEPLIGGKSSSMNNQNSLVYIRALNTMLKEEPLKGIESFENFKKRLLPYLRHEVIKCERNLYKQQFLRNTLYSIFIEGCKESKKDITEGGAVYHNVGMTTVGLGNLVNALLNIKRLVFDEKKYSLIDVKKMSMFNYKDYEEAPDLLKEGEVKYGQDKKEVIDLSNEIQRYVSSLTDNFRTPIDGRLKFGASSPSYIDAGNKEDASFDGRKKGEPFIVHISNENLQSYTELISFASELDYEDNRFNGNVVDFMVSPSFIDNHFDKFTELLIKGTKVGYFQLQTNVVSSDILKEAKTSPEKFPNLIVRVWGFSAYFVELPEAYQDLLIRRALQNEGKIA